MSVAESCKITPYQPGHSFYIAPVPQAITEPSNLSARLCALPAAMATTLLSPPERFV